jgi:hypothetical protein
MSVAINARIVVALDPDSPSDVALDMARYLQESAAGELLGVFVEDTRVLAYASSRLAREVVLTGGERPLERPALERQIRAQTAEQRRRFESAATRLGLKHAFHVARGEWLTELVREAAHTEGLIVTLAAHAAALRGATASALRELVRAPLRNVLFVREGWATGRGIVTLLTRAEQSAPSLRAAVRFARASRSPLTVLMTGGALQHAAQIEQWLDDALHATGLDAPTLVRAGDITAAKLYGMARDARLVVLPAPHSRGEEALINAALETLRVPLLLVREEADR